MHHPHDPPMTLWQALLFIMASYPTEPSQVNYGLWSAGFGAVLILNPHVFDLSHAYDWMRPIPGWAWGAVFFVKGAWQVREALTVVRDGLHGRRPRSTLRVTLYRLCWANVILATVLAYGFLRAVGPLSTFMVFYGGTVILNSWLLVRGRLWLGGPRGSQEAGHDT